MKKKQKKAQIILISIGLFLIIMTYFYYPYAKKIKFAENEAPQKDSLSTPGADQDTSFENVEYQGSYDLDKTFTVNSEKAHILSEEPNVVYMTNMHVVLYLADGRTVNITSNKGRYNKITYDCFFESEVRATEGATKIFAENLDLLASEDYVKVYNNVIMNHPTGSLRADKVDYDFETKYFRVSMFDDKTVKMKVFK